MISSNWGFGASPLPLLQKPGKMVKIESLTVGRGVQGGGCIRNCQLSSFLGMFSQKMALALSLMKLGKVLGGF